MAGSFTGPDGDLENLYITDYAILDRYVGAGSLWTWGRNQYGQLGDNTITNKSSPIQTISGGTNWTLISTTNGTTCHAIKSDGTLWGWGDGRIGGMGNNTVIKYSSPVQTVSGGTNWKQVESFSSQAAIKTDGSLWTWGYGNPGTIGDGASTSRSSPVQTTFATNNWKQVSVTGGGGGNVLAVKTDGTLWGWGYNSYGSLGIGSINASGVNPVNSPVQIGANTNWRKASIGWSIGSGIKTDGTLWIWGYNNYGQLAQGTTTNNRSSPIQVGTNVNWKEVSAGTKDCFAIKTDGTLWVWGRNNYGQLGTNDTTHRSSPVQTVAGGTNWKQVSNYSGGVAAIKTDGTLWTWGFNLFGQLGTNDRTDRSSPVQTVSGGTNWKSVAAGFTVSAIYFYDSTNQYPSA
jgi:alpha-tubulin suppressor-like RCC1 family protein